MKHTLREYGVAIVLIAVGVAGYLFYYHNRDDILASSLDIVGARLVEMVDDPASRQFIADRFARFKQQVLEHEVSPEQVETVAANVFNLSSSGSTLTSEQAELVLEFATAPESVALPEPDAAGVSIAPAVGQAPAPEKPAVVIRAPGPPTPPRPADMEALGKRLHAMVVIEQEMQDAMKHAPDRAALADHFQFQFKDGLHVSIDTSMVQMLDREAFEDLAHEFKKLEKMRLVTWRTDIAAERQADRARVRHELASVQALRRHPPGPAPEVVQRGMAALESLKHLEMKGFETAFSSDSLRSLLKKQMRVAVALQHERSEERRDALEDYLDNLDEWIDDAIEVQEAAIEAQQEALEARLERDLERREAAVGH